MAPRYNRIAVIGAGPSGLAAVRALAAENAFSTLRVFDRRDHVGGLWHYDPEPDVFPGTTDVPQRVVSPPSTLPGFAPPAGKDPRARSALYWELDSNVGAETMAFSYAPFPKGSSASSLARLGANNPSRTYNVVAGYLEDLFTPYLPLVSLGTTVERVEKAPGTKEWTLTLRKEGEQYRGTQHDYWWTETFDAVVVASGHYHVPLIPSITGLIDTAHALPGRFEHSKSYRKPEKYTGKRVLVVGGSISAVDFIQDLHDIVQGKLEVAIRGRNPALEAAYNLPNVRQHPTVASFARGPNDKVVATFSDGSVVDNLDSVLFATGYRLQYPFLQPNPTTPQNYVSGFYQHVFNVNDPSLTLVGQVKAALSFRIYEYQAVAVARYYAGRNARALPSVLEQRRWEADTLKLKGASSNFHEIAPDLGAYYNWLADFAGKPAKGTDAYELPQWQEAWGEHGFSILDLKAKYWQSVIDKHNAGVRAKL
ncbi:hypothetical protein SCUCBS95973_007020 [Sporothrix curviconia]|uniref:Dimethylaniline monooxygenase n=1 Tax=Sporothrix curviconia TaxID=1260050 RepID=A0ABP0C9Z9_9PEZI